MYIIRIKNLANYARQIQYYKTNRYIVLKPYETVSIDCEEFSGVTYYQLLNSKQFSVEVDEQKDFAVNDAKPSIKKPYVEPEISVIEFPKEEQITSDADIADDIYEGADEIPDSAILEDKEDNTKSANVNLTLDELTDAQLKAIVKNLGITTSVRAKHKLIDLINLNLPDGAKLSDYLK